MTELTNRVLTTEEREEIRDLYLNLGMGRWRIAKQMHMCVSSVDIVIKGEGIERSAEEMYKIRAKGNMARDFTPEEALDIAQKYKDGMSLYQLRRVYNVSNGPLFNILTTYNVPLRSSEQAKKNQKKNSIVKKIDKLQKQLESGEY